MILLFIFSFCASSWKEKVYRGDREFIKEDIGPGLSSKIENSQLKDLVSLIRREIESDRVIFDKIYSLYYNEQMSIPYRFMFAAWDIRKEKIVIKYFARFPRPKIYAGISVVFVVAPEKKKIEKIFVQKVPLE